MKAFVFPDLCELLIPEALQRAAAMAAARKEAALERLESKLSDGAPPQASGKTAALERLIEADKNVIQMRRR